MLTIDGKVLITTDWHFGVNQNRSSKLRIVTEVSKKIISYIKKNKIDSMIFGGDMFHQRNFLSIETINIAIMVVEEIAKCCKVYLILGNHDLFNKNTNSINSMKIFKNIRNVHIIEKATECSINGNNTLLIPWNSDLGMYEKNSFDMLIGHFDISEKYLIASYVEDHIKKDSISQGDILRLKSDDLLRQSGLEDVDFENENEIETIIDSKKSSDLIGDWIEIVKEKGTIFSGHIHNRKEFFSKNRKFIFIGSPYQQTLGEADSEDGFYVMDEKNRHRFVKLDGIPVHIDIKMSDIVKDIESFDFSIVSGNIIHKIYDIEVDNITDSKITRKISERNPYEELPSDYIMTVNYNNEKNEIDESISAIRRSKLEYIQNYINNIGDDVMKSKELDKDKLFKTLRNYYDIVNEGV